MFKNYVNSFYSSFLLLFYGQSKTISVFILLFSLFVCVYNLVVVNMCCLVIILFKKLFLSYVSLMRFLKLFIQHILLTRNNKTLVYTNGIILDWKAKNWHQMFPRIFYGISQFDRDLVPSCVFRVTVNSLTFTVIQRIISALGCSLQLQVMLVKYFKISHFYKWCHCLHSNAHLTSK